MERSKGVPLSLFLVTTGLLLAGLFFLWQENEGLRMQFKRQRPVLVRTSATVFFLKSLPTRFILVPVPVTLEGAGDPHRLALEKLFEGPPSGSGLSRVFPSGARVLALTIKDSLATVDLSSEATRLNVGAEGEALAIAALVNTLTKFSDVQRVRILIEGEAAESLAGHVDLTREFRYDGSVVGNP
jgi:spore germination protein GerM